MAETFNLSRWTSVPIDYLIVPKWLEGGFRLFYKMFTKFSPCCIVNNSFAPFDSRQPTMSERNCALSITKCCVKAEFTAKRLLLRQWGLNKYLIGILRYIFFIENCVLPIFTTYRCKQTNTSSVIVCSRGTNNTGLLEVHWWWCLVQVGTLCSREYTRLTRFALLASILLATKPLYLQTVNRGLYVIILRSTRRSLICDVSLKL